MEKRELFLVYTDVVGSTPLDLSTDDPIAWRRTSFLEQLKMLLSIDNALALKSIGDALFIIIDCSHKTKNKKELCQEVLACTYKAYLNTKTAGINSKLNKEINIRAVVHLIKDHCCGEEIANEIIKAILDGQIDDKDNKKSSLLIQSLKDDIFGTEVNKAARIQSLVRADAILISEEIAKIIEDNPAKYNDNLNKLFYITFKHKDTEYQLHSPVPVIKLKGLKDISYKSPLIVWQLDQIPRDIQPALATEFKSYQMFRLLLTGLKKIPLQENDRVVMQSEVDDLLELNNLSKNVFSFYNDFIWDVIDEFEISPIKFTRNSIGEVHENIKNQKKAFEGNFFCLKPVSGSFKLLPNRNINVDLLISKIVLCSFPSREVAIHGRQIVETISIGDQKYVLFTEPQTIDIYTPSNLLPKKFDDYIGSFILMFFGVYIQNVSDANNENTFFSDISSLLPDNDLKVIIYGINSGLVDGFVLFKVENVSSKAIDNNNVQTVFESPIASILNKYKPSKLSTNFFSKTFPISLFLLSSNDRFKANERNISYLKRIKINFNGNS